MRHHPSLKAKGKRSIAPREDECALRMLLLVLQMLLYKMRKCCRKKISMEVADEKCI